MSKQAFFREHMLNNFDGVIIHDIPSLGIIVKQSDRSILAYSGKRGKPDIWCRYANAERAREAADKHVASLLVDAEEKAAAREAKKAFVHGLVVGDVLRCSWGYDQTNVDYYQVTRVVGKQSVELREIGQMRETTGHDQGTCIPHKDAFIGEAMVKRVNERGSVRITSFSWAYKVETIKMAGVEVFKADHWTAYA